MAQANLQPGALSCLFRGGFVVLCEAQASWGLGSGEMLRGECATGHCVCRKQRESSAQSAQITDTVSCVGRGAEPEIRALVFHSNSKNCMMVMFGHRHVHGHVIVFGVFTLFCVKLSLSVSLKSLSGR